MKRVDKSFRWRRGQLVEIPPEWVGQTVHPQQIRKRQSKLPRKLRRFTALNNTDTRDGGGGSRTHATRTAIQEDLEQLLSSDM